MDNICIRGRRGTLHFIRFPTSEMGNFLALAKSKGMANLVTTVCATGGGAFKFEDNFKKVWKIIYLCLCLIIKFVRFAYTFYTQNLRFLSSAPNIYLSHFNVKSVKKCKQVEQTKLQHDNY